MFLFLSSFSFLLFCLQIQQFSFISKLRLGAIFYFCVTWSVSVKLILTIGVLLSNSCNCMTWTVFCLFFILPFYSIRRFFRIFVNLFFFYIDVYKRKERKHFFSLFSFCYWFRFMNNKIFYFISFYKTFSVEYWFFRGLWCSCAHVDYYLIWFIVLINVYVWFSAFFTFFGEFYCAGYFGPVYYSI